MAAVLMIALALAASTAAAGPAAPAPPPVSLIDLAPGAGDDQRCLPEGPCLSLRAADATGGGAAQLVVHYPPAQGRDDVVLELPFAVDRDTTLALWPHAIPLPADDMLGETRRAIGVIVATSTMYSGGGGSGGRLHLLSLAGRAAGLPRIDGELLDIVWDSQLTIRACFSEADARQRRGACHDDYDFSAALSLAPQPGDAMPGLRFVTVATAFPRTSRRNRDSSDQAPLTRADLTRWRDPECSYTRLLRFNPGTARYEMDQPAPDCSDYTTP